MKARQEMPSFHGSKGLWGDFYVLHITKEIVVNEPPFDEGLDVFDNKIPLVKFIDDIHDVIIPLYPYMEHEFSQAAEE